MSDSQCQLSTEGPYYSIPSIKQLEINVHGFVREIDETGKMIPPSRTKGLLYYNIIRYKSTWPGKVRRAAFMRKLGFTPQIKYDGNELYNEMRNRCFHINRKLGFAKPKSQAHEQKRTTKRKKPTSRPKRDAQGIKQCLTDRPCKDGRSSDCFLYLPEGYWARCPACWAELREQEGYDQIDFSGQLSGEE